MATGSDNVFPKLILSEGAAPSAPPSGQVKLYAKTDGLIYWKDDAGTEHAVGGGSGGASLLPLDALAASSVGSGDHFGGTSLAGAWSDLQSTALTTKDASVDGYLILGNNAATGTDVYRGIDRAFSPAGDFSVWARIERVRMPSNFIGVAVFVGAANPSDSAGGNRIQSILYGGTGVLTAQFATFAAGSKTTHFNAVPNTGPLYMDTDVPGRLYPLWLGIRRVGTAVSFGMSMDGIEMTWHTTTTTIAFTVATVGLAVMLQGTSDDPRAIFDYVATTG